MNKYIMRLLPTLLFCGICGVMPVAAQTSEEIIDVRTRVVFVDAFVRDKRTGGGVNDLKLEDFEVLDEGRARTLSYFSREGDANRKPLALVLALNLERIGAGRFMRRTEVIDAMTKELARLPPQDEVAVMVLDAGGSYKPEWLTKFTSDRAQTAAALAVVPSLVGDGGHAEPSDAEANKPASPASESARSETSGDAARGGVVGVVSETKTIGEAGETITRTVYENGETLVRTTYINGRVSTTRISKNGTQTVEIGDSGMMLASATAEALRVSATQRPASRTAIVWVSDGLDVVFDLEQADTAAMLLRRDVIFNALVADMKFGFKLFKPVLKPLGNYVGMNIYDSAARLARDTGGVNVRVRRPDDYARGLGKIIGDLTGRYSLGFTLAEDEPADARMRKLEVRVNAKDAKGKRRKLEVAARRGYFIPGSERPSPAPVANR